MKRSVIRLSGAEYPFEDGLFGVNTEITRKGFFGGLSTQMINNKKLFESDNAPSGRECDNYEYITDRKEESLCGSNFVILKDGSMSQTSSFIVRRIDRQKAPRRKTRSRNTRKIQ